MKNEMTKMNIIYIIFFVIMFAIAAIFLSLLVLFSAIIIEFKLLMRRNRLLREELTKSEARLLDLTKSIIEAASLINAHIFETSRLRKLWQDKKQYCKCSPENNTADQNSKL
jgi:ABC-type multidrug transport system fused ATPase/permease subunit